MTRMHIWWLADPRLLTSDTLREEHHAVHRLVHLGQGMLPTKWDRPLEECISLLVLRHDLIAAAMTDRTGHPHTSSFTEDMWMSRRHNRAVIRYETDCEKYQQIQVGHMDLWFRRLMRSCAVPNVRFPTPWGYARLSLDTYRKEQDLDPLYYCGHC